MDKCSTCQYNPQILDRLKNQLPDEDVTDKLSEMFNVVVINRIKGIFTVTA